MKKIKNVFILLSLCVLAISSSAYSYEANVNIAAKSVAFVVSESSVKFLSVKIADPDGNEVFAQSATSSISWNLPANAIDGRYKYEVRMSNISAGSASRDDKANATAKVSTQSGSVLVKSGSIILPTLEETGALSPLENTFNKVASAFLDLMVPQAHADQVILDDLIVGGSTCVGQDCVNGETFNFDTLRLKENNLRIHFQDTSNSASFPTNDWRILINDSSNGGGNLFAIEDADASQRLFVLEAGAPSNSLYIDANGRVGFGTSNPSTMIEALSGSTPTFRFNQDGSLGFTPQAWDIGGNEGSFFIRDASNSLATPLRIAAGAPSDSLFVNAAGNIGVGINAPTEKLHVVGNAVISGNLELGSSRTIKHAIENLDIGQAMAALLDLEPVKYRYNHSPDEQTIGFIAEDVPDLVASTGRKSLKPMDIVAVLTKVVQAQQATIDELSRKVEQLADPDKTK